MTLFANQKMADCIEQERQKLEDKGDSDKTPELEASIIQSWNQKRIIAGKTFPHCDGTVVLLVERSLGIDRFSM